MSKFIDINTFEIKDNYFEVDDNIAEAISLLNKKGYKTRNCCEGHLFLEEFAVGGDETVDDEWETNCEVEEGYIEFDSSITITSVPNGWTLCDRSDIEDTQTIYFEYPVIKSLKDIKVKSPYNLYVHKGYGPGPFNNPSLDSISAVLNPIKSNYLYFVANLKTGKVYYNENYDEHLKRNSSLGQ